MEMNDFYELMSGGKYQLQKLVDCNQYTQQFGLKLSEQEALVLVQDRKDSLREQQRVEFGDSILPKLIFAFCDSSYIYQDNYVDTIGKLQDIFFLFKNETLDELTDDELIEYMRKAFEEECEGSLEYLEETILERLARGVRSRTHLFIGGSVKSEQEVEGINSMLLKADGYEDDYE